MRRADEDGRPDAGPIAEVDDGLPDEGADAESSTRADGLPVRSGIAVLDIDGVVADVRHRLRHLDRGRWHRFFVEAADDPLLAEGSALARDLARTHDIVWLSGRPEWLRAVTETWLTGHDLPGTEVHLRRDGDYRPAPVFKVSVLRRLAARGVAAVVDDDVEVVTAARDAGFAAVLADWVPRSDRLRRAQDREGRT